VHARLVDRGAQTHACCLLLVGFFVAGPDGVLGGAASRALAEHAPASKSPSEGRFG